MATELSKGLKDITTTREKESAVFEQLNKEQELAHFSSEPMSPSVLHKGYREAFILAAEEFKQVSESLDKVRTLIKRRRDPKDPGHKPSSSGLPSSGSSKSKKVKSSSPFSVPSTSASPLDIWSHAPPQVLPTGMEVAALVDKDSEPQLWILAGVSSYRPPPRPRYTVIDLDPGEESGEAKPPPKVYQLEPRKVIPLPSLKEVGMGRRREFSRGSAVLALFPAGGVTTFYRAEVVQGPKKLRGDKYLLRFDDDEEDAREVSAQYVAPYPGVWTEDGWMNRGSD